MKYLIYTVLIVTLASCMGGSEDRKDGFSATAKTPEDSLFQAVMDEHDAAMAKMGRIAKSRKELDQKIDSIKKIKSPSKSEIENTYAQLNAELKQAEDGMNTWMQEFSIDSAQDDPERRLQYLGSEKSKVSKVKEEILAALAKADSLLKK